MPDCLAELRELVDDDEPHGIGSLCQEVASRAKQVGAEQVAHVALSMRDMSPLVRASALDGHLTKLEAEFTQAFRQLLAPPTASEEGVA